MTQTEAFEATLSQSSDATVLRGKLLFAQPLTTTPVSILALNPSAAGNFGARASAMSGIFSRYRFKYLKIRFLSNASSVAIAAVGVQDEPNAVVALANVNSVAELRCSGTDLGVQTVPTIIEWRPVDHNLWYYTQTETSGDPRLVSNGNVYAAASAASTIGVEIDYCIVFKGATDTGTL